MCGPICEMASSLYDTLALVVLDALPLTPNGKVDRRACESRGSPERARGSQNTDGGAVGGNMERNVGTQAMRN